MAESMKNRLAKQPDRVKLLACVFCGIWVDVCPAESLYPKTEYRLPLPERETITLRGEPKQKIETKQ
jgi:formate hydrogenlyase subunit 6/NADH:ubiquinone oxidoreductase subunit I